jgi:hypothetical protein
MAAKDIFSAEWMRPKLLEVTSMISRLSVLSALILSAAVQCYSAGAVRFYFFVAKDSAPASTSIVTGQQIKSKTAAATSVHEGVTDFARTENGKNPLSVVKSGREMLYASGEGAIPSATEEPNRAKAYLQAKAYAKMQAIANLVQLAKGTIIEYTSKGENYVADAFIKQQINGVLDSIQVVSVSKRSVEKDIIVAVTVRAPKPLPPKLTPASITPPEAAKTAFAPTWLRADPNECSLEHPDGYTSVIIDAQGLNVCRSMSPRILRPDGSEVWGTMKSDYDFICDHGIVAYARNRADASTSIRAGTNPLVVRAIRAGNIPGKGEVVVSSTDARLIEEADSETKFLEDFRVIVIVDSVDSFTAMNTNSARR